MSTTDTPGYRKENNDELAAGCWAEHADGSLLLVESTEADRVIYSLFHLGLTPAKGKPFSASDVDGGGVKDYRDVRTTTAFKREYSYDPAKDKGDGVSERWTWHDKTPFPWQRVIDAGMQFAKLREAAGGNTQATRAIAAAAKLGDAVPGEGAEPFATPAELLTAAQRVAATLKLKGQDFTPEDGAHKVATKGGKSAKGTVMDKIGNALRALRGG
jgi:hypothetical protein